MRLNTMIWLGIVGFSSCAFQNSKLEEVDNWLEQKHLKEHFHGAVTIGTAEGGVYSRTFGTADRNWNIPIENDTRFDIASINKSFIAYMIMQLVEAGKVGLEDKLSSHLDYQGPFKDTISIHQMLTHTSGLPDYDMMVDSLKANQFEAAKRMYFETDAYVKFISRLGSVAEPGSQFHYSNFAYHLLAILIEKKVGKHFSVALDSMVCKPLGLQNTFAPRDNYAIYERVASPYQERDGIFQKSPFIDYSLGRRIFSTTEDLNRWGREMVNPTLISSESHKQILTNHVKEINPQISYGYGWVVFDGQGSYRIGRMYVEGNYIIHGGATDGFRSLLVVYEEGEWIVSILGNTGRRIDELGTGEHILKILTSK